VGKKCACYIERSGKGKISRLAGIPFTIAESGRIQREIVLQEREILLQKKSWHGIRKDSAAPENSFDRKIIGWRGHSCLSLPPLN
jgi:hypothetical protein